MEVEHWKEEFDELRFLRQLEEGRRTLKREKDVETNAPAGRVLEETDELDHEGSRELFGEGEASDGDDDSSGHASKFLRSQGLA